MLVPGGARAENVAHSGLVLGPDQAAGRTDAARLTLRPARTLAFLRSRQAEDGAFVNVRGTLDPSSAAARLYNTTQALVALHALGATPWRDPVPVLAALLEGDYKALPPYTTSFFPLAYRC